MANIVLQGTSWSFYSNFASGNNRPTINYTTEDTSKSYYLNSITLYCCKPKNSNTYATTSGGTTYNAGEITGTGAVYMTVIVNGVSSDTRNITNTVEFAGQGTGVYANSNTSYTFTFSSPPTVSNGTRLDFSISGLNQTPGSATCISIRQASATVTGTATLQEIPPAITYPTDIWVSPNTINLTSAGSAEADGTSVYVGPTMFSNFGYQPVNSTIENPEFRVIDYTRLSLRLQDNYVYATATDYDANYETKVKVEISVAGGAANAFYANFLEKVEVKRENENVDTYSFNIGQAANQNIYLLGYKETLQGENDMGRVLIMYRSDEEGGSVALLGEGAQKKKFQINKASSSSYYIPLGQLFDFSDESNNIFKIESTEYKQIKENQRISLAPRFYNPIVQGWWSSSNGPAYNKEGKLERYFYRTDFWIYVTYSITPNNNNLITYDYLDKDGNIVTNVSDTVLLQQNFISIGNLGYDNSTATGGFCRGFRVILKTIDDNIVRYDRYYNLGITEGDAVQEGITFTPNDVQNLPYGKNMSVVITPYFYYTNTPSQRYFGASVTLKQKFINLEDKDLLPKTVFPITSHVQPYTKIQLVNVERVGYAFDVDILKSGILDNAEFGVEIGKIVPPGQTDYPLYVSLGNKNFSADKITQNIVYRPSNAIQLKNYPDKLYIKPVLYLKQNGKTTEIKENDPTLAPNIILDCSTSALWTRPSVSQGTVISRQNQFFTEYYNLVQFLSKYQYIINISWTQDTVEQLLNRLHWNKLKQGTVIKTELWTELASTIGGFADEMLTYFATDVVNDNVLWQMSPYFKHKKGEKITTDNLYQNYYDIVIQLDYFSKYATYGYLNSSKFTHSYLHKFTHKEIQDKEKLNNG